MIHQLVEGQEVVIRTARTVYPLAVQIHDQVTADLLTKRMQVHEKDPGCCEVWSVRAKEREFQYHVRTKVGYV